LKAGASLLQIYTPLFIKGPYFPQDLLKDLEQMLKDNNISDINEIRKL
jgi:dihydroorotate dehydrogenase